MRNLLRAAMAVSLVVAIGGCGLLKKIKGEGEADDAAVDPDTPTADAEDAAPTDPPEHSALAANEDDIARFPDETTLDSVTATVQRTSSVREAPLTGAVVMALGKDTEVVQVAEREKYSLVVFTDPNDSSRKLMGWLHQDAFAATAPQAPAAAAKSLSCKSPEIPLFSDRPFCGRSCAVDTDCPAQQACKGSANKLSKDGKVGDAVTICTVYHAHDAGAPKPVATVDAGVPPGALNIPGLRNLLDGGLAATDAGAKPADAGAAPTATDAGTKPAAADLDVVAPTGGKCAAGFFLVKKDNKCHRICNFDCKQKETQACVKCGDVKVCTADRNICK
jgi:hypothetical protein